MFECTSCSSAITPGSVECPACGAAIRVDLAAEDQDFLFDEDTADVAPPPEALTKSSRALAMEKAAGGTTGSTEAPAEQDDDDDDVSVDDSEFVAADDEMPATGEFFEESELVAGEEEDGADDIAQPEAEPPTEPIMLNAPASEPAVIPEPESDSPADEVDGLQSVSAEETADDPEDELDAEALAVNAESSEAPTELSDLAFEDTAMPAPTPPTGQGSPEDLANMSVTEAETIHDGVLDPVAAEPPQSAADPVQRWYELLDESPIFTSSAGTNCSTSRRSSRTAARTSRSSSRSCSPWS